MLNILHHISKWGESKEIIKPCFETNVNEQTCQAIYTNIRGLDSWKCP